MGRVGDLRHGLGYGRRASSAMAGLVCQLGLWGEWTGRHKWVMGRVGDLLSRGVGELVGRGHGLGQRQARVFFCLLGFVVDRARVWALCRPASSRPGRGVGFRMIGLGGLMAC